MLVLAGVGVAAREGMEQVVGEADLGERARQPRHGHHRPIAPTPVRHKAAATAPALLPPPGTTASVASELLELRRSNERLVKQLAELNAASSSGNGSPEDDEVDDEGVEQEREDRIKVLQKNMQAVILVCGGNSPEHRAKKEELDGLQRTKREGTPFKVQLQNVDRRIDRQRQKG